MHYQVLTLLEAQMFDKLEHSDKDGLSIRTFGIIDFNQYFNDPKNAGDYFSFICLIRYVYEFSHFAQSTRH